MNDLCAGFLGHGKGTWECWDKEVILFVKLLEHVLRLNSRPCAHRDLAK